MDATQIILIVFIVLLIIIYPIMISTRNKKENQRMQEQTNSLKRGDKVLTTSGVYGTIVDLQLEEDKKIVTIETGTEKKKGYISVDAYAIYTVFKDEKKSQENKNDALKNDKTKQEVNDDTKKEDNKTDTNLTKDIINKNEENKENVLSEDIDNKKSKKK